MLRKFRELDTVTKAMIVMVAIYGGETAAQTLIYRAHLKKIESDYREALEKANLSKPPVGKE